ncbi:hypothetical protein Peur_067930 [Populus x canadensis]
MNAHKLILVPPLLTHLFFLYLPPQQAPPPLPPLQHSNLPHQKSPQAESSSSSSSSTTTSQSFTQGRFPLSNSPPHTNRNCSPPTSTNSSTWLSCNLPKAWNPSNFLLYIFSNIHSTRINTRVVANLKNKGGANPATKILLALCLSEEAVVEVAMELNGFPAERALAALELTLP